MLSNSLILHGSKFINSLEIKAFKCNEINNFEKIIDAWDLKSPIFIECSF